MDMNKVLEGYGKSYCDKHGHKKTYFENFLNGSWICTECDYERAKSFRDTDVRLEAIKNKDEGEISFSFTLNFNKGNGGSGGCENLDEFFTEFAKKWNSAKENNYAN